MTKKTSKSKHFSEQVRAFCSRIIRVLFMAKPHLIENLTFVSFHPIAFIATRVFMDVGFKPPSNTESGESHINL